MSIDLDAHVQRPLEGWEQGDGYAPPAAKQWVEDGASLTLVRDSVGKSRMVLQGRQVGLNMA